jgi:hypothetical protein
MGASAEAPVLIFPPTIRYTAPAVLSEELVLFLKRDTPCLELCRVSTSLRGMGNINGDDAPLASLRVVRTLALPIFHPDYCVHTVYIQTDRYCPRQRDPEVLQQQRQRPARASSPLTFHSAPEDMVVKDMSYKSRAGASLQPRPSERSSFCQVPYRSNLNHIPCVFPRPDAQMVTKMARKTWACAGGIEGHLVGVRECLPEDVNCGHVGVTKTFGLSFSYPI